VDFSLCNGASLSLLYKRVADCFSVARHLYPGLDDTHYCTAYRAGYFGTFLFLMKHLEWADSKNQLQKSDEFFTARMKKAVISGSAKSFRKDMEHQQIEKIFAGNCPGLILSGFGMQVPECNHTVFVFQDILGRFNFKVHHLS